MDVNSDEMRQTQIMIAQEMGQQAVFYGEIYYPRTDKRSISKHHTTFAALIFYLTGGNQYTYEGNHYH